MPIELSPHNPRLERVRDLATPRGRRAAGRFVAEGPTLLGEAARAGLRPLEIYATAAGLGRFDAAAVEAAGTPVYQVAERIFARLSDLESPTGLLAVYPLPERSADHVVQRPGVVLVLAGVNDPGNAGTLVRSAEAFGAAGVLFGQGGVDPYAPKVVRAAMGSLFRLPVATVAAEELLSLAERYERPVIVADIEGDDLRTARLPVRAMLAVGNERRGVRDWLPRWDRAVKIPHVGAAESLNAAVAGSIVLYEATRCQEGCQVAENP
ncbi:MAG TPA: RNA methyltransferase [Candidatus Limnocylindria bacterium]|nr:RNA methyltransferase [Candidatus Limnocylindria bacterium]